MTLVIRYYSDIGDLCSSLKKSSSDGCGGQNVCSSAYDIESVEVRDGPAVQARATAANAIQTGRIRLSRADGSDDSGATASGSGGSGRGFVSVGVVNTTAGGIGVKQGGHV